MSHPLREVLAQVASDSCPGSFNFHCHTVCSDGSLDPVGLVQQATDLGLTHLAVTDPVSYTHLTLPTIYSV